MDQKKSFAKIIGLRKAISAGAAILSMSLVARAEDPVQKSNIFVQPKAIEQKSQYKPHVGIFAGVASPEGSYDRSSEIGLDVGYQPIIPFGLGILYSHSNLDQTNGGSDARDEVLAKLTYNFGGDLPIIKNSFVGAGVGASFTNGEAMLISAPLIGFDIDIAQINETKLSLGANARYVIYEGTNPDSGSISGVAKLWF